ncbi:hypothetical protein ACNTMW_31140 [Planosporangium sp. 12N6]|uniref:hypothetical protein n=1 Tax=Planosporangium spinosum TaxID=3402278 RepID=UPI003CEDBC9E
MASGKSGTGAARRSAERAATEMLRARAALVGDAAVARDERDRLRALADAADAEYAARYQAALAGGWSPDELNRLNLDAPDAEGNGGRRRRSRGTPTPDSPADTPASTGSTEPAPMSFPGQ